MIGNLRLCDICIAQFGHPPRYAAGDCRVHRADENGFTILNFEGSRTGLDWVTNLHAGWNADATGVLPLILADRASFAPALVVVGHSKGGADAQDFADALIMQGIVPVKLVTFEAPAVNDRGGRLMPVHGNDYAHHGDPVPLLPPFTAHPRPLTWLTAPALPEFPDPASNHHLATAVRPALVAMGIA